jgi:hypothetical protein
LNLNISSTDVDYDTATAIIHRCIATRPDLLPKNQSQLIIKMHGVGLRPCRKGGVRVEAEWTSMYFFLKKNEILIEHVTPSFFLFGFIILLFSF